ncbi:VCBS domain-containing protein [Vibrio splendidus]|uniref:VCBS domain-containing protein n=1 Tax=Vibrio splendidus TaxID=29497 RepID=UPI003D125DF9
MANKKNVEANKKNTEIKNKKSNKLEQKKPTQKKKRRLHSHLKVNIPLFQSLMMILPSLAKHAAAESIDNSSDAADQVTANNVTEKDVTDDHNKADSSAVALQEAQTSDNDVNSTLSASHAAHGSSSHLVPSHHLSTLSHPQVHYIPSVSMPTVSSGSNGQPTHSNAPTTPALPVTFMPEVIKGTYGELHVDANGQYTFVLNPNSPQYILLNQHQPGTDHFALHLSNGSSIIVQIPVTGKQDTPSISGDLTGVVTEDHNIDSQGLLHANGKIDVIDPDQNESSVTPEVISGKYGSLTIDADGHWQYQVDNSLSNVQALTAATSLHESFTIHTKDGTPQTIDMTIGGNDDNAVITGVDAGTLTEDLTTQVQGQLSVTDSDLGEDHFQASQVTSNFGTLSITKDGAWTYSLDNNNPVVQRLGQGSTATDIVTVHSADGTAHQVMVTINGTNDHAVITSSTANSPSSFFAIGTSNGSSQVTEDKDLTVSGQLNITDIDSKEAHFSNSDLKGTLGTLHLKDNGDWTYDLDNKNPQVQALGQGSATTDIITIHSADGTPHQIAITVNGTNDKAVISGTSAGVVTEESQLQTSGILTVTDVDTGEAHFATSSTGSTDIAGSFGTLHLTDTGSWTYDLDNTNPTVQALGKGSTATDTITVHSADGTPHQVTITVNGTNDAATVSSATVAIDETDKAVTTSGTLTSIDVDNPDNAFTPDSITGTNGNLTIGANGQWTFTANSAFNQLNVGDKVEETFTVSSVDGTPSTIKVTINGTNDAATVSSATVAIDETDKVVTTSGTLTSTDVDNPDNTFTPDSISGTNGDLTIDANGHWMFTANSAFNQLNVGDKVEETFTVSSVDGTASTIKVTINGTNDKAVISGASAGAVTEESQLQTSGSLTVTDVDAGQAHFSNTDIAGTLGTLHLTNSGTWTYDLDNTNPTVQALGKGTTATDTITVHSADGTPHQITITVNGTNDKAIIGGTNSGAVTEESQLQTSGTLTVTDVDTGEAHFSNTDIAGTLGTLHLTDNGTWTYDLDNTNPQVQALGKGATATDTITVNSADGTPHQITITVNGTNDTAVISGTSAGAVTEETQLQTSGSLTITDTDTGEAHFSNTDIKGSLGTLHLTDAGQWTYDLDNTNPTVQALGKGAATTDTITVTSADGTTHQVTIAVNGTNDKAVITGTNTGAVTEDQDLTNQLNVHPNYMLTQGKLFITDVDTNEATFPMQSGIVGDHGIGSFTLIPSGIWLFSADSKQAAVQALGVGETLTESTTITSVDGTQKTILVTINGTNDAPVITPVATQTVTEDGSKTITFHATDIDTTDTLTPSVSATHGSASLNAQGEIVFTPDTNYNGPATVVLSVTDGHTTTSQTINVDVTPANDAPVINSIMPVNATEDGAVVTGQLTSTDIDAGDTATFTTTSTQGGFTLNADGSYNLDPTDASFQHLKAGEISTFTIPVTVTDSAGATDTKDLVITVTGTNDTPVISGVDTGALKEDVSANPQSNELTATGKLDIVDIDTGEGSFVSHGFNKTALQGHYGKLEISQDGSWSYSADNSQTAIQSLGEGEQLTDTIKVTSKDGTTHDVVVTINGTNDKAVIGGSNTGAVTEESQLQTSGTLTVTDVDTGEAHFANTDIQGSLGTLHLTDNGAWTYDLDNTNPAVQALGNGATATDTITVHSADGTPHQVTITVNGTNDNAVVGGVDTASVTEKAAGDNMSPDHAQSGMATLRVNTLKANGHLSVIDPDSGQSGFADNNVGYNYHGTYGDLILNPNGDWNYYADAGSLSHIGGRPTTRGSAIDKLGEGETLTDTITVHTKDGTPHNIVITINGSNDRPYCSSEVQLNAGTEDTRQTITAAQLLQNSIDVDKNDSGLLTVANLHPDHGSILDNQNGTYTFTPEKDYNGKVHFTYDVKDAHGGVTHTGATSSLSAVADKAVISGSDTGTIIEDHNVGHSSLQPVVASGLLSVTDPDAGQDHFQVNLLLGEQAIHDPFGGFLRITPSGAWGYEVANSRLQSLAEGEVEKVVYRVYSADHTAHDITITVTGTNDQPTITATTLAHGTEDTHYQMQSSQFGFNDIDTGDTLHSIAITDLPPATQGKFVLDGHDVTAGQHIPTADISKLQFVPAQDFNGDVQFKYTVNDGHVDSQEATNTLHIDAVGDAAVITGTTTGDVDEGHGSFGDMSPDYAQPGLVKLGQAGLSADGKLDIVDPDTGESQFDSKGGAWNNSYHGQYGHLILNPDGTWHYHVTVGSVDWVSHRNTTVGTTIDELGENQTLTDTITVYSKDGTSHDIVITIHGDNDRPYISSEVTLATGTEDTALTFTKADLLANTVDVDANDAGKLSIANLLVDHGSVVDNKDGTYTLTPTKDYNGQVHFSYDVTDAHGGVTATGANLHLQATGDAATITGVDHGNVTEDRGYIDTHYNLHFDGKLDIVDPDQGEAQFDIQRGHTYHGIGYDTKMGGWVLLQQDGTYTYRIDNRKPEIQNLGSTETLVDKVTIHSVDGTSHEIQITIHGTNDDPKVSSVTALPAGTEDTDVVLHASDLLANATDIDHNDAGQLSVANLTADHGKITDNHDGTFTFHPALDYNGKVSFTYDVKDAHAGSTATSASMTLAPTSDAAVITGPHSGDITEDKLQQYQGMLSVHGDLHIIDPDSGEDHFTTVTKIHDPFNSHQNGLIISPSGYWYYSVRNDLVQHMAQGETTDLVYEVSTVDGTTQRINITLHGTNDNPHLIFSGYGSLGGGSNPISTDEDKAVTIPIERFSLVGKDIDHGDALHLEQLSVDHGTAVISPDGKTVLYTPEANFNGRATFTYYIADSHGARAIDPSTGHIGMSGMMLSVNAVSDKAIISGVDTASIIEDHNIGHSSAQKIAVSGSLSVTDPDAGEDHFRFNQFGEKAIHDPFGGDLRITPAGSWGYEVSNNRLQLLAHGQVETVIYRVYSVDNTAHDITITVTGTNDQPTITATTLAHGTEDTHYQMQASQFGFTDVDTGDTLHSIAITDLPPATQGKFVLDGHDVTAGQHITTADITKLQFVPAQDFNGDVQFKYTVNDGHVDSQEATNTLHIDAVGDAAVITGTTTGDVDEGHGTYHDRSPNYAQPGMAKLTNDPLYTDGKLEIIDPDTGEAQFDTKGVGYSYHGTYGQLILNADGNWHYKVTVGSNQQNVATKIDQLGDGQELTDTITIYSKDGTAQDIVITIHGDNDRPYISSEVTLSTGTEDTALTFTKADLLANTVDVDANDAGKLSIENLLVDHGSVVDNKDGTYTFTPTKDYNGQVHFSYDVTDAHGGTTHTGANTSLAAVNDAATFTGDSGSIGEDTNIHHNAHITGSATIPDALSCHGHLIVSDADGHGEAALDLKGQPKISLDGTYGHFDITSTGTWVYKADNKSTPIQDLDNGQTLTDSIEVTSKDGTKHSITVTINGTTDDPVLHSLSDSGVQHSGPVEGNLLTGSGTDQGLSGAATDTDSNAHLVLQDIQIKDPVSGYVAVRPGQPHTMAGIGTLAIEANGHYTFTPEAGFTGKVPSMVYRVGDDGGNPIGDSSQNSLSIEVTPPLQHAPTVTGQTVSTNEDITRTITTSEFGYSDQDGDALQFVTISSIPSHGLLLLNGNAVTANQQISKADLDAGHLTFTPNNNENGANYAQFTFTANDGHKNSAGATMVVDVNAVNDAPIVGSSFISSLEDKPHAFTTADFKYSDIDGDALNHITITNVAHGVLSLNGTTVNVGDDVSASDVSSLIFTPTHNYFSSGVSGLGGVQFTANDGHLDSKEGSILINIASVADPATFSGDSTGVAKEDITLQASGTLTASDPDGTAGFTAVQGGAGIAGSKGYGHAHIDVNGHWTYDLDNNHPIVQQLGEGQTDTETITVQSADGTHHDIVVTITGTNDAPILGVNQTSSTAGTLTETDVDVNDTHTFSIVSSTGQFGSLSVDPNTGDYIYTPNTSITGMSYNSATNSYHGVDVFEVKVSDGHTEDSKFITFDASGHVTMSPTGSLVTSTTLPHQPVVTATQPTLPSGTNVAPTNTVTLDLASTSDSGSSQTDNLTNDTTPTITGHTDIPFSKVTIYDGSTPVGHSVSDASGQYSVAVSSLSEGDHNLSAKALAPSSVLPATSSLLSVHIDTQVHVGIQTDPITADNVINAQESNSSIDITGSVSGDYNAGDIVTLDVNGTQHTGVVDAKGHYSIAVPGSELIADADQKIEASVAVTDTSGNSAHATADVTYQVDTQVSVPTITFENSGADNLYSKAEIARGQANTITATVTPPGDAKIGEHLVVNGQDHVLDANTLQHGIQIEVHPGSNVQATMTDEHGNTAGSQGFAASAIPEPIIVRPPSGSHQVSGTLGIPPLLPSLTPVPTAQSGWRIHLPNGQYVTSHHGQYGTLTIDPQTGHLHYQEQAQVHTGPHGSASGIGQHEDKFEVALQGSNQDEVVAHVNIQILSHGPGHSGKLTVGTEVVDMTITPLVHTSHPAPPPPPPVQHDEPDMASQADFTVTLSDDSNLDLTQQTHQEPDQKTSHHGAAAYLDALGIKPDATSTTVHDQPADMDIVLAQVDQQDATTHDQAHLDMSDALEHHDANINHNQDDEHHHNDIDGLPDIDPNS